MSLRLPAAFCGRLVVGRVPGRSGIPHTAPPAAGRRLACAVVTCQGRACSTAAAAAATPSVPAPPTVAPTLGEVQNRKRALRLQDQLLHSGLEIISHDEYLQHSGSVGLTRKDADSVLADLDESGAVVCVWPRLIPYCPVHTNTHLHLPTPACHHHYDSMCLAALFISILVECSTR